jgi:hypothetical protein
MSPIHVVERAFQMADDPKIGSLRHILAALSQEAYGPAVFAHLDGPVIRQQLRARIQARLDRDGRSPVGAEASA